MRSTASRKGFLPRGDRDGSGLQGRGHRSGPESDGRLRAGRPGVRVHGPDGGDGRKEAVPTTVTILADKEEIGSNGNTGLDSDFVLHYIEDLAEQAGVRTRDVLKGLLVPVLRCERGLRPHRLRTCMRRATPAISTRAACSPSTPAPGANPAPTTPAPRPWPR